jgi:alpha-galactosidase
MSEANLLPWEVKPEIIWRRWMLAHNVPRPGGKLPAPLFSTCMGLHQNERDEKRYIDAFLAHGVTFDYWWMDAGWYPCGSWPEVGTWEPDPQRFPNGIKGISDYVHARGMKLILWFEPERVEPGSWLATTKDNPTGCSCGISGSSVGNWRRSSWIGTRRRWGPRTM